MPRAKKPDSQGSDEIPLRYWRPTEDQIIRILARLGHPKNWKERNAFINQLAWVLHNYYYEADKHRRFPTEKSLILSVDQFKRRLGAYLKAAENLDPFTFDYLQEKTQFSVHGVFALRSLYESIGQAIENLSRHAKTHHRPFIPLRRIVTILFEAYCSCASNTAGDWREFVSEVLTVAGINHPDPIAQRTRFDKLLIDEREHKYVPNRT